jgi:hypothetical protein
MSCAGVNWGWQPLGVLHAAVQHVPWQDNQTKLRILSSCQGFAGVFVLRPPLLPPVPVCLAVHCTSVLALAMLYVQVQCGTNRLAHLGFHVGCCPCRRERTLPAATLTPGHPSALVPACERLHTYFASSRSSNLHLPLVLTCRSYTCVTGNSMSPSSRSCCNPACNSNTSVPTHEHAVCC